MIDLHSHIIPGVDDGAKTLTESVELIRELVKFGVTDIVATPHFITDSRYQSLKKSNLKLLNELKSALTDEGIDVNIYLGNEIYIDKNIKSLLEKNKISAIGDSKYLLIEMPLDEEFPNYEDIFLELLNDGYRVILAHPERYAIVQEDFGKVKELFDMGVLLQCNLGSIVGKYGKEAKKVTKRLAKEKMIFAIGSDIHHAGRGEYLIKGPQKLAKYYSDKELKKVLVDNPRKIIQAKS